MTPPLNPQNDVAYDVIWKVSIPLTGYASTIHDVPASAKFVSIGWDPAYPERVAAAVWFRVPKRPRDQTHSDTQEWELDIVGTGSPFPMKAQVLGTVTNNGYAWHVLDLRGNVR